jgi:hypothetical protein
MGNQEQVTITFNRAPSINHLQINIKQSEQYIFWNINILIIGFLLAITYYYMYNVTLSDHNKTLFALNLVICLPESVSFLLAMAAHKRKHSGWQLIRTVTWLSFLHHSKTSKPKKNTQENQNDREIYPFPKMHSCGSLHSLHKQNLMNRGDTVSHAKLSFKNTCLEWESLCFCKIDHRLRKREDWTL